MSSTVIELGDVVFLPGAEAIINAPVSKDIFTTADKPIEKGSYKIVPWGEENNLPELITKKCEKNDVVNSNLQFNAAMIYGGGVKAMELVDGELKETEDERVVNFLEQNDVNGYLFEQATDTAHFYNPFPEIILNATGNEILSIRSKEATFSRWGVMNKDGKIDKHYYADWAENPDRKAITQTPVLDFYNPYLDLEEQAKGKEKRFIVPINVPTPGRRYYQRPYWWSIFESGWYDYAQMIPEFKTALLKNQMVVKFIIYLSEDYFPNIYEKEGIDPEDIKLTTDRIQEEYKNFNDFLAGAKNAGKALVGFKEKFQRGNGVDEHKNLEIEVIKHDIKGGELLKDSSEVTSIIGYAMGVHSSLIGPNIGGSSNSLSGSNVREVFMMKQALARPIRHRLLKPLYLVKQFNKWNPNLRFIVQDIEFPTLDAKKDGKQEVEKE